jgi:hypothetical protein
MKIQQDRYNREKRTLREEMKQMKIDNRIQKVSVSYIQPNLQCCQGLFICDMAYQRIM